MIADPPTTPDKDDSSMRILIATTAVAAACLVAGPIPAASAAAPRVFANCTAMHRVHPHGVGRRYAHDHTSGTPVTNFYRNNALYSANSFSDRDHDGIACESR